MKTTINKETGAITLHPENDADRELIFHLMDCTDLSQFTNYVETFDNVSHHPFTTYLGVKKADLLSYPAPCDPYDGGVRIWRNPLPYAKNRRLQEYVPE